MTAPVLPPVSPTSHPWGLNTSNAAKVADYRLLMARLGMRLGAVSAQDLPEVQADALSVLRYKANTFAQDHCLVDDASFDVDGADIGVNARWLVDQLPSLAGRLASMRVLIGFRERGLLYVVEGVVHGQVVAARGTPPAGFPLLPFFCPRGRAQTLAEHRDDEVNPRALALANLMAGDFCHVGPPPPPWRGPWQKSH